MTDPIIAFLPCRKGSERIPSKNTKLFANIEGGLLTIKIKQLLACDAIDKIIVSTDDPRVISIASSFAERSDKTITIDHRPENLALSTTKISDLIKYIPAITGCAHIVWVHVTEPFADEKVYGDAIKLYRNNIDSGHCDSLMSVTPIQTFIWDEQGPYNYIGETDRWPRSQDLQKLYEINCAFFIIHSSLMKELCDRVGRNPCYFELDFPFFIDIDTPSDFNMAEKLWDCLRN